MRQQVAFRLEIHETVRFKVHHASATRDKRHGSADVAGVDMLLHRFTDASQALSGEPRFFGACGPDLAGQRR